MAQRPRSKTRKKSKKIHLVVSDQAAPTVQLKKGMKLDVIGVSLVTSNLKKAKAGAARLCSGGGTCIALVELDD
ncbi:hypothetical protein HY374_02675 [Candidatus Berkelbacteria bacterium]|nr:hypothetical protein [Candidatus Berkelbacteria bacterium]